MVGRLFKGYPRISDRNIIILERNANTLSGTEVILNPRVTERDSGGRCHEKLGDTRMGGRHHQKYKDVK